ncbi:MAG: hypothetical protein A3A51_00155 [Candidatus Levybacteria bacterium RIFCSPLOWO2_01_FULL_39_10]|nr:MAG: hypothetical protein A3A51_00155 [Candidatus Levybacteria bacterium RIFCSPLOWO2_01_FULL_39_10]
MKDKIFIFGGGILIILAIVGAAVFLSKGQDKATDISKDQIVASNGIHWHPKLNVYINGEKQEFENNIGLGAIHQPMHTHDEDFKDGVVHMEMSGVVTKDDTKLGNFFKIWGKEFNSTQIFDKKSGEDGQITMAVNGKENKDFENYQMRDGDKIEIRYE